jgi:hypothetical protein
MPLIKMAGDLAGFTNENWMGIRCNTPVMVGLGDMQCSTWTTIQMEQTIAGGKNDDF